MITLEPSGRVTVSVNIGKYQIQDRYYPVGAVETAVLAPYGWVTFRPDTYQKNVRFTSAKVSYQFDNCPKCGRAMETVGRACDVCYREQIDPLIEYPKI